MNKTIVAALGAGVLVAGLVLAGPLSGNLGFDNATAQSTGVTKKVYLVADETEVQVAPDNALHPGGVTYQAMVWNGTIPGPVIAVDQGDTLEITVENRGDVIHSMDFHAGFGPSKALSGNIAAGESKTWTLEAVNAGVFYYHCGADALNGVWEHIANGMYGGIVVHPENETPAKEFYVVFGEIYASNVGALFEAANGTGTLDLGKFLAGNPDLVLTNGMAFKYVPSVGQQSKIVLNEEAEIFKVKPGEQTRWYIVNPGPNDVVAFHFISGMIDVRDGSIGNRYGTQMKNDETWIIPPGSASVIEAVFPEEGIYVGVDHAMNDVLKGGAFAVLAVNNSTATDHPEGTWVPPKGSESTGGVPMTDTDGNATDTDVVPEELEEPTGNDTSGNMTSGGNATSGNATSGETGNETGGTTNSTSASGETEISITPGASSKTTDAFDPNPVSISVGDTVTWTNDDSTVHTATSGKVSGGPTGMFGGSLEEPELIAPGESQSFTFTEAGDFPYYCILHPAAVGTISVS
jgi:nitrite reductase (NO-forming)